MGWSLSFVSRLVSLFWAKIGYFAKERAETAETVETPEMGTSGVISENPAEQEYPDIPGWITQTVPAGSFVKVGRIAICADGLEIHSDLDDRGFILLNEDIDAVLDGDKRAIRLLDARDPAGSARLSASGRALNLAISPYYYTVPLRSVSAVLDGRNRKGAMFMGK